MPEDSVKIRVRSGESEAEIEASFSKIREAIELIPEVLAKFPIAAGERSFSSAGQSIGHVAPRRHEAGPTAVATPGAPASVPTVVIEKGDSLNDVIFRFFSDSWGMNPRKLMEVREALQSYGLNYPKQSVAVALLRLAKGSKIRRFKAEGGEYVYTASTGAVRIAVPSQPVSAHQAAEQEAAPALEATEDQEEQLNLDAPAAN